MAKKLTLDDIQKAIKKADYYVFPGTTMTVCCLTLLHDFTVIGESACMDPEGFDAALGRSLAQQDAVQKIWQLEAYLTMYKNAKGEDPIFGISAINDPVIILTPEVPVPPPAEPDPLPLPPVESAPPGAPIGETPSGLPIFATPIPMEPPVTDPVINAPLPADPVPVDPPVDAPVDTAPVDTAPPAPTSWAPFTTPPTDLTAEQLAIEEQAMAERERIEGVREDGETVREAEWEAGHVKVGPA